VLALLSGFGIEIEDQQADEKEVNPKRQRSGQIFW